MRKRKKRVQHSWKSEEEKKTCDMQSNDIYCRIPDHKIKIINLMGKEKYGNCDFREMNKKK